MAADRADAACARSSSSPSHCSWRRLPPRPRDVLITPAQSGKTFHLAKGARATLRLPGRWSWTQPRVSSTAIELTPVAFFVDPGYSEWVVKARARGRATIRATGSPSCVHCGLGARSLRVTIAVP